MRLKDRKAIWLKKLSSMTPVEVSSELAKLERELERKNEVVNFLSKVHTRTGEDWRRYHNRKMSDMNDLIREYEKVIESLKDLLDTK